LPKEPKRTAPDLKVKLLFAADGLSTE